MLTAQGYVRTPVCTVCFQWNIHTNPVHSSAHRVATTHFGAGGYPQRTNKLRVAWQVMGNTRPVRTNTADRAACMLTTQGYVRILVCTVCFQWNIHTNREHSSEHRVETTGAGAGGNLNNNKNYELLGK
jgi:phage-related protein